MSDVQLLLEKDLPKQPQTKVLLTLDHDGAGDICLWACDASREHPIDKPILKITHRGIEFLEGNSHRNCGGPELLELLGWKVTVPLVSCDNIPLVPIFIGGKRVNSTTSTGKET